MFNIKYMRDDVFRLTLNKGEETDGDTENVLLPGKGSSSDGNTSVLNEEDLDNDGCNDDSKEEKVVEEALEHVELVDSKLS